MAVVQISKIQIRRGRKNQGEGIPQLSSGELGWAVDSQELFIGNGSVSEGAPFVGNTKILTQHDNLFALTDNYIYKKDFIQTGSSTLQPVARSLQERLDDFVTIKAFDASGLITQDASDIIQRAIDQIYLQYITNGNNQQRCTLYFSPGEYKITKDIYIPSFVKLIGAGSKNTVVTADAHYKFITINDSSTIGNPALDEQGYDPTTTNINQAKNIHIEGIGFKNVGLRLLNCKDSFFANLEFLGDWSITDNIEQIIQNTFPTSSAITLHSLSEVVKTTNNKFSNLHIQSWSYGFVGNKKIDYNIIEKCQFFNLGQGINFGQQSSVPSESPTKNLITKCTFEDITTEAINIVRGDFNTSEQNIFKQVGNLNSSEYYSNYPVIRFTQLRNQSSNDFFERTQSLATSHFNANVPYVEEVTGSILTETPFINQKEIISTSEPQNLLRLPGAIDQTFEIHYTMQNNDVNFKRHGVLTIVANTQGADVCQLVDEYEMVERNGEANSYNEFDITFSSAFIDDGEANNPKWSIYVYSQTGGLVTGTTYFNFYVKSFKF